MLTMSDGSSDKKRDLIALNVITISKRAEKSVTYLKPYLYSNLQMPPFAGLGGPARSGALIRTDTAAFPLGFFFPSSLT